MGRSALEVCAYCAVPWSLALAPAHRNGSFPAAVAALVLCSLMVPVARGQVALDASTFSSGDLTQTAPNNSLTFAHTSTGTNLVLVVGVSMNISGRAGTTVSGVTYNGTALQSAVNQLNGSRRTEIWYLAGPATGNHNVVVTLNIPGAGGTIGVVAGATTFTGADQTTPIRSFGLNSGTSANAFVNVASSPNDMVLDTLALLQGNTAAITSTAQTQQWAVTSGASNRDTYGFGSTREARPAYRCRRILARVFHGLTPPFPFSLRRLTCQSRLRVPPRSSQRMSPTP